MSAAAGGGQRPRPAASRAPLRGRFAPSPTGPLHFGSLIAALGSFLQARSAGGAWRVRIEDLDAPRVVHGSAASILRDLDRLGLHWDGEIVYQSRRGELYREALAHLARSGWSYPCGCSRRDLRAGIYPGTCRAGLPPGRAPRSVRVRTAGVRVRLEDAVQGSHAFTLENLCGDFVVHRADGHYAYHLAVVVDDAEQGMTEIVRGSDLLESTACHIHVQNMLGLPQPAYAHLPVAADVQGRKLGKQTRAAPIPPGDVRPVLHRALRFLGQRPPADLLAASAEDLRRWALAHWRLDRVPRAPRIALRD